MIRRLKIHDLLHTVREKVEVQTCQGCCASLFLLHKVFWEHPSSPTLHPEWHVEYGADGVVGVGRSLLDGSLICILNDSVSFFICSIISTCSCIYFILQWLRVQSISVYFNYRCTS